MSEHPRHVVAVTGFVTDAKQRVLLVRVADRGWEMPGGQVETGESLLDALRREVEEESGCRIEIDWFAPDEARRLVSHPPSAQRLADAMSDSDAIFYRVYRLHPYEALVDVAI